MARRYERDNDIIRSVNFNGNYTSKGSYINDGSGNGIADFELGDVSAMGQRTPVASGDASLYYGMPEYSAFFGDNWNATRNLTVTLGLTLRPADSCIFRRQLLVRARPDLSRMALCDAGVNPRHHGSSLFGRQE